MRGAKRRSNLHHQCALTMEIASTLAPRNDKCSTRPALRRLLPGFDLQLINGSPLIVAGNVLVEVRDIPPKVHQLVLLHRHDEIVTL